MSVIKWDLEALKKEAIKYKTRSQFQKNSNSAYVTARRLGFINLICSHMPNRVDQSGKAHYAFKWNEEKIKKAALECKTKAEFELRYPGAVAAAKKYKIYKECTSHMISGLKNGLSHHAFKWTEEKLRIAALKYSTRSEFKKQNPRAYDAAVSRGLMDSICSHMRKNNKKSTYEIEILTEVKKIHKQAKSLSKRNISIPNKPHIKGFDIDIFIPELNKGIEFDGDYWHSYKVMRSSTKRKNWPDEDIRNYHEIKDTYFKSIGIEILHIKESDWIKNKNECLNKIWNFLKCV